MRWTSPKLNMSYRRPLRPGRKFCAGVISRYASTFNAFTIVNPSKPIESYISGAVARLGFSPSSAIIATTPQHSTDLRNTLRGVESLSSVIGVCVDSIPPASQRDAISICLFRDDIRIIDAAALDDGLSVKRHERGITVGRVNWALSTSLFSLEGVNCDTTKSVSSIVLPVANTVFTTGTAATMVLRTHQEDLSHLSHQFLSSLRISLPPSVSLQSRYQTISPLITVGDPKQGVTSATENMIKTINGEPAARVLQNSEQLMSQTVSDSHGPLKVFAMVDHCRTGSSDRYEVIAGGGGEWSPRAAMLVLEPRAKLSVGDLITFGFAKPLTTVGDYEQSELGSVAAKLEATESPTLVVECAPTLQTNTDPMLVAYPSDHIIMNVFGMSSEYGFLVNDLKHSVVNEMALIKLV